eukprot:6113502-Prymnesium_polylepis.2
MNNRSIRRTDGGNFGGAVEACVCYLGGTRSLLRTVTPVGSQDTRHQPHDAAGGTGAFRGGQTAVGHCCLTGRQRCALW